MGVVLKPGQDPRKALPRHSERGPVLHEYTLADIATAAGVEYQTVRAAMTRGKFKLRDLQSVSAYIHRARVRKARILNEEELTVMLPASVLHWWDDRWPLFDLFKCAHSECTRPLFSAGFCSEHGGDRKPPLKFDSDFRVVVLLHGCDYVSLHRLIVQPLSGMHTHHRDGNPWNNRWENLEELTASEHEDRHVGGILSAPVISNQPPRKPFRSEQGDGKSRAEIQQLVDEAYLRGLKEGRERR